MGFMHQKYGLTVKSSIEFLRIINANPNDMQTTGSDPEFFEGGGGLSNIVYAHCKVKSVRGGALKQNFMDNNTRSVSLSLAVTPALSG